MQSQITNFAKIELNQTKPNQTKLNRSIVGGYDKSIVGWNLSAETDQPIFQLFGHESVVVQVAGLIAGDRCISLGEWEVVEGRDEVVSIALFKMFVTQYSW